MQPKLGILAGGGQLPVCIIEACQRIGRPFHVITFHGQATNFPHNGIPITEVRLGAGGKTLKTLRKHGVEEIILAGSIARPSLAQLRPDAWGIRFLARSGVMKLGDDGLLSILLKTLEQEEGFRVVGVADVAPELLAPDGVLGTFHPSDACRDEIKHGVREALNLGAKDIGQAVVMRGSQVIGREGRAGTDVLLANVADHTPIAAGGVSEGVLVKVAKPQQERRADLPTIGVDTVKNVARAGLAGIAVEAGGALILERDDVIEVANELKVFVVGVNVKGICDNA